VGVFSISIALLSAAEPIKNDSETKLWRFLAISFASSIVPAYCKISRAISEIGSADLVG